MRLPLPVRAALAVGVLHLLATVPYPWEAVSATAALLAPSPDLALVLAWLALAGLRRRGARLAAHLGALATLAVPVYRFGQTVMPVFYEKAFEPWVDLHELPGLLHLLAHDRPWAVQLGMALGAAAVGLLLYWFTYRACRTVVRACEVRAAALVGLGVLQAAVVVSALRDNRAVLAPGPWRTSMAAAAVDAAARFVQDAEWLYRERFAAAAQATSERLDALPASLEGLDGADVYVFFLESYGRAVLHGADFDRWAGWLRELEGRLATRGYVASAAWAEPTVHGGGSVQAHLEFMSGIEVPDRRVLDLVLASGVRMLPQYLARQGYATLNVQPAMPRSWPEAAGLGFATEVFQSAFPYAGHVYHWGRMPDQFALQHVLAHHVRPSERPVFMHYVSVTSHAPFHDVPPYYEDWSRAAGERAFTEPPARTFAIDWANYAGHPDVREAYFAVVEYSLRCVTGFLLQVDRPVLAFVLGDHQPPLAETVAADRSRHVPIHAITNRPHLLEPLVELGFTPGLVPDANAGAFATARFLPAFVRGYAPRRGR